MKTLNNSLEEQQKLIEFLKSSKIIWNVRRIITRISTKNVGLVEGEQFVKNQTIKVDAGAYVEFAIIHPSERIYTLMFIGLKLSRKIY